MKRLLTLACLLVLLALAATTAGPWRMYVVNTGSMEPAIPVASAVVVKKGEMPRPGQVVTFSHEGSVTTHRLMASGATKGDANRFEDPWQLSQTRVVGTVQGSLPYLGYLLIFLRQPTGALSVVLMLLLIRWAWRMSADAAAAPAARPPRPATS